MSYQTPSSGVTSGVLFPLQISIQEAAPDGVRLLPMELAEASLAYLAEGFMRRWAQRQSRLGWGGGWLWGATRCWW